MLIVNQNGYGSIYKDTWFGENVLIINSNGEVDTILIFIGWRWHSRKWRFFFVQNMLFL